MCCEAFWLDCWGVRNGGFWTKKSKSGHPITAIGFGGSRPVAVISNLGHYSAMANPPKTPQEKKGLSLARDRRNTYGNNQKAARKAIPLRKALENRRVRHKDNQAVSQGSNLDEAALELAESSVRHGVHRLGGWKKGPDEPLGSVIERALKSREQRVGRKLLARFDYGKDS
jgi:hypothetical protein